MFLFTRYCCFPILYQFNLHARIHKICPERGSGGRGGVVWGIFVCNFHNVNLKKFEFHLQTRTWLGSQLRKKKPANLILVNLSTTQHVSRALVHTVGLLTMNNNVIFYIEITMLYETNSCDTYICIYMYTFLFIWIIEKPFLTTHL